MKSKIEVPEYLREGSSKWDSEQVEKDTGIRLPGGIKPHDPSKPLVEAVIPEGANFEQLYKKKIEERQRKCTPDTLEEGLKELPK